MFIKLLSSISKAEGEGEAKAAYTYSKLRGFDQQSIMDVNDFIKLVAPLGLYLASKVAAFAEEDLEFTAAIHNSFYHFYFIYTSFCKSIIIVILYSVYYCHIVSVNTFNKAIYFFNIKKFRKN